MNWKQWPFYPKSLTEMIGPGDDSEYREAFVSLLASGCSERLSRPLTILEPELSGGGDVIQEPDPDNPGGLRLKLRRIDQINPREHFTRFCELLRQITGQEEACQKCDEDVARQVIQVADQDPKNLGQFSKGYLCHRYLLDQAGVIRCHQTPVAVVFSGQFLPDGEDARRQIVASIDKLAAESALPDQKQTALRESVRELKTRDEYVEPHVLEGGAHSPAASTAARKQKPTAQQLFLDQVREIERIALAQFEMHKRDRENAFRHQLRELFPALPVGSRQTIAGEIGPVMEIVRGFCGSEYLAFFISPQRYISYESSPHLLEPFLVAGIDEKIKSGIAHFNWRKAGLASPAQNGAEKKVAVDIAASKTVTQPEEVRRAIEKGLKSKDAAFFGNASILCQMYLSDAYRAVLIWGPFSRLTSGDLGMESRFLEEVSELVMTRVLSLAQLSDSEARTAAWENVAALLGHYSRRAMTPMSTGVRIIADYLESGGTYSKQDAQNACDSLEAASRFISQAVRAPLFSFAAMAEEVYKFAPASLEALVRDCVVLYHPMALERAVTVKIDPSLADLPKIEVDETKMRDAIGYVLDNAIKYSHHNKEVRINGELSGSAVRLSIEDFGLGMDEDELHLIFGRGYQGRRSRKAIHEEGEGMGLFHARLIIEAHKGKIWADCRSGQRSEASARLEGYRVRFTLELPIKQLDTSDKSN